MNKNRDQYFKESYQHSCDTWTHLPLVSILLSYAPQEQESVCLDIGCGHSDFPQALMRTGHFVIGIDIADEPIEKQNAETKAEGLGTQGRFLQARIGSLPFSKESFDFISDVQSFHYLHENEWQDYVDEVSSLLKEGGLYLNVSLSKKTKRFYGHEPRKLARNFFTQFGVRHYFFTKRKIAEIFSHNFEVLNQEEHVFSSFSDPADSITLLFSLMKKKA